MQQEKKVDDAKNELKKYMFYFERYNNHHKAENQAKTLKPIIQAKIQLLHDIKSYPFSELIFLEEAVTEVIRCRHVLKYTYVYGYYIKNELELNLFQTQQEMLEKFCEHLHGLIEKPLDPFLDPSVVVRTPFYQFRDELINYFNSTKSVRNPSFTRIVLHEPARGSGTRINLEVNEMP